MITVKFYDTVEDHLLKFAVIVSKYNGQWVFCKHRDRATYEWPGGHREYGEPIDVAAKRELWEETGAEDYEMTRIGVYCVIRKDKDKSIKETYGMIYYADIKRFGKLPDMEIEKIQLFDDMPNDWTYPEIQPLFVEKVSEVIT